MSYGKRSIISDLVLPCAAVLIIGVGIAVAITAFVGPDTAKVCKDTSTNQRVQDSYCNSTATSYAWRYLTSGRVPAVGETIGGGAASAPKHASIHDDVDVHGVSSVEHSFGGSHGSTGEHVSVHVAVR